MTSLTVHVSLGSSGRNDTTDPGSVDDSLRKSFNVSRERLRFRWLSMADFVPLQLFVESWYELLLLQPLSCSRLDM